MSSYKANPISRKEIRQYVLEIRKCLDVENKSYFDILGFAEIVLPCIYPEYSFEVSTIEEMGEMHGQTWPDKKIIKIREDVYLRAVNGEGRDRLTIAHEIGHLFLHGDNSISLCRLGRTKNLKAYEDPEWQANAFAGELLAPSYLIKEMDLFEISTKCGISESAAKAQLSSIKKEGRE